MIHLHLYKEALITIITITITNTTIILLMLMSSQVDAYREAGKEEAASRLEEQLSLIHTRFQVARSVMINIPFLSLCHFYHFYQLSSRTFLQELSSKFELFQQPADYDAKLNRIAR